jgi:hypothetical protein
LPPGRCATADFASWVATYSAACCRTGSHNVIGRAHSSARPNFEVQRPIPVRQRCPNVNCGLPTCFSQTKVSQLNGSLNAGDGIAFF